MKNLWKKFALAGLTGMMLSSVPAMVQAQDVGFDDTPAVKSAMDAVNKQVDFMEKFGLTKGINYTLSFDVQQGNGPDGVSSANVFGDSSCDVSVGLNNDGASSMTSPEYRGQIDKTLGYTEEEKVLLAQTFAGHEVSHCRLVKIANPFQLENAESSKLINKIYGNTLTRGVIKRDGKNVVSFGLGDFLNESYADGMAFTSMVKASNGSDKILNFFKKVSANRHLQTLKVQNEGVFNADQVDAYDLRMATEGLNTSENIKKIKEAQTPQELDKIVLENSNKNVWKSLSNKSVEDLQKAIGVEALHHQAVNYSVLSQKHIDKGSLVAESIEYAKSKLSQEDRTNMEQAMAVMASSNFGKMGEATKTLMDIRTKLSEPLKDFMVSKSKEINEAIFHIHQESLKYKTTDNKDLKTALASYENDFKSSNNGVTNLALNINNDVISKNKGETLTKRAALKY